MAGDLKQVFQSTASVISVWKFKSKVRLHSAALRLYQVTAFIFGLFSALSSWTQAFGEPINCVFKSSILNDKFVNNYCWFHGTSTFNTTGEEDRYLAETGIKYTGRDHLHGDPEWLHYYYQWVGLTLIFQCLLFSAPYMWWTLAEGGRVENLLKSMEMESEKKDEDKEKDKDQSNGSGPDRADDGEREAPAKLGRRLAEKFGSFHGYAAKYIVVEVAGAILAVLHICFINWLLNGRFTWLGMSVLKYEEDWHDKDNPLAVVFPRMTSCSVRKFGHSGNIQNTEALCIVPLNIINEKIYLFLWFWLHAIVVFAFCHLFFICLLIAFSFFRNFFLKITSPDSSPDVISVVTSCATFSDWFVTWLVACNLGDVEKRRFVLLGLATRLRQQDHEQDSSTLSARGFDELRALHPRKPFRTEV